ncbi:MAG: methyltransferase domain-containing protein [Pseudomonadota bacterium]
MTGVPSIFDSSARHARRDRAARTGFTDVEAHVAEVLLDRLSMVSREFGTVLIINSGPGALAKALRAQGMVVTETDYGIHFDAIRCDEDNLSSLDQTFDLVIAAAGFETIDDLPGALIAARRMLKPGGMFLATLFGAPSLPSLRAAMAAAQRQSDRHVARFHPEIDVRAAGDLLPRTGFILPVADLETQTLSYASLDRLLADLRAAGATNVLAKRYALTRAELDAARQAFAAMAGPDGRTVETVSLIILTGWAAESV